MRTAFALAAAFLAIPTVAAREVPNLGVGFICRAEDAPKVDKAELVRLPGMGSGGMAADTAEPEAKAWFDYGLKLYHAFYHEEAEQAFAKAAALDPKCGACAWGVSLSLGSTLNTQPTPAETAEALKAAERAEKLAPAGDARLQGLIAALKARYQPGVPPGAREGPYGRAMSELARRFPEDHEIANLAAHALIIPARVADYSGVARAEELLEGVLAKRPNDTAAIHYYIHATEFAGHAAEALPYAERLAELAPQAGHLVHMGTHTLMRVGEYHDVAVRNAQALKVDSVQRPQGYAIAPVAERYYAHNYQFGLAGALMSGDRALALKYADHAPRVASAGRAGDPRQAFAQGRAFVALGRLDPDRALALPEGPDDPRAKRIYRQYARGEAFAAKGDIGGAGREAKALLALSDEARKAGEVPLANIAAIAADVVAGRAAMSARQYDVAAEHFAAAAERQKKVFPVYDNFDPPPWWYPVRRSLAAAHLKAGRYATAAREARTSLADWPQDALALRVLAEAEAKLGQRKEARRHAAEARRAWRGNLADVPLELT